MQKSDEADIEAIRGVINQVTKAYVARDPETFVGYFTDDAVCLPPNRPPIIGKDAWRSLLQGMFERSTVADFKGSSEEIVVTGDWAIEWHNESAVTTPRENGESRQVFNKGVWVFRRQTNGSWRIARYIWNASPAPEP